MTPATPDLSIHANHYIDYETELKAQPRADSDIPGNLSEFILSGQLSDCIVTVRAWVKCTCMYCVVTIVQHKQAAPESDGMFLWVLC